MANTSIIITKNHLQNHIDNFSTEGSNTWLRYMQDSDISIDTTHIKSWVNKTTHPFYGLELLLRFNELSQLYISNKDENPYSQFTDNRGQIVFKVYHLKNLKRSEIYEEALVYEVSQHLAILRVMEISQVSDDLLKDEWLQKIEPLIPFDINCFSIKKTRDKFELQYNNKQISFKVPFHLMHQDLENKNKCRITEIKINEGLIFLVVDQTINGGYYYSTHKKLSYVFNPENLSFILKKELDSFSA